MITEKILSCMIEIITERVLTPVVYMFEEEIIELIVFCDGNMDVNILRDTENEIYARTGTKTELVDIREFDEFDRWQIVQNAELIYAMDDTVLAAFERAMQRDVEFRAISKAMLFERRKDTGSYYLM